MRGTFGREAVTVALLTSLVSCGSGQAVKGAALDGASDSNIAATDAMSAANGSAADVALAEASPREDSSSDARDAASGSDGSYAPDSGGGSSPSACAGAGCAPINCYEERVECGPAGDGCGGLLDCGPCPSSETCRAGACVWPADGGPCVPASCASRGYECGMVSDGCGSWIDCGVCSEPRFCGGGGFGRCGGTCDVPPGGDGCFVQCSSDAGTCSALSCLAIDSCGFVTNPCGNVMDCGPCAADAAAE